MKTYTASRTQRNENSRPSDTGYRPRIHTAPEEFNHAGSALARARKAGIIDGREYKAGQRMTALWQATGQAAQRARLAAGRALLTLGENVALVVISVCKDNCGVGNSLRASLLKQGLGQLALHFAMTAAARAGGFSHV